MSGSSKPCVWMSLVVAFLVALSPWPTAAQSGFSPADAAVVKAYVLDVGKANRYIAGLSALAMAKQTDGAIAEELERMNSEDSRTLAQMRARLARNPRIFAFFQRQNLTADDAVLIPIVIIFAGVEIAAPGQMTDAISPAQVNFVRANAALMERLRAANEALEN